MPTPPTHERPALQGSRVKLDHPLMTDEDAVTELMDERPEAFVAGNFLETASPKAVARFIATVHELVLDVVDLKADGSRDPDNSRQYTAAELRAMRQTARLYRDTLERLSTLPRGYLDNALQEQYAKRSDREAAFRAAEAAEHE